MKSRKRPKPAELKRSLQTTVHAILVRPCHMIEEFEACVGVERAVWKSSEIDVVPIPLFVVASETGGQVLGAFHGPDLVGFTLAIAGWRAHKPFLHSHMTAVLDGYRDRGIGRQLKLYQRRDALARGIALVEWTFAELRTSDPSRARGLQSEVRDQFLKWLGKGCVATGVEKTEAGIDYILESRTSI